MNNQTARPESVSSLMLKAGKRTYFFDVKCSASNKKYLKITESTLEGEGQTRKYNSFLLFPEQAQEFQQKLAESMSHLA